MLRRSALAAVTMAATTFCAPAALLAGGNDHFGGNETSKHSSFGGDDSSFGNTGGMARGSAHQGGGGFSLESLAQVDHIGAGGSHVVDTFKVNSYYDTAEYQGRTVSEEGAIGQSMQRMEDARRAKAFEEAQAAQRAAAAAKRATEAPAPAPAAAPIGAGLGWAPAPTPEPAAPAPVEALPELGAINTPRLEIVEREVKPRVENLERREFEKSLRAIERAAVTPGKQDGNLNKDQRRLSRLAEDGLGAVLGAIAGGWFGGGIAKATLPEGRVREIARQLAPLEGAVFGVAKSELHKTRRLDALIEDITEMTPREMRKAKDYARQQPAEERARIMDAVRDLAVANEQREKQGQHAIDHSAQARDNRGNRTGGKDGKNGGKNGGKGK